MLLLYHYGNGEITYKLLCTEHVPINKRQGDAHNRDFLTAHPTPDKLRTVGEKLRWYRLQHDMMQKDCAAVMQVDRNTYAGYEEDAIEAVPLDKLQRLADHYRIDIEALLDDYNLFLLHGQGRKIKKLRKSLQMSQSEFAAHLQIPLGTLKNWESERTRMIKPYYIRLFWEKQDDPII